MNDLVFDIGAHKGDTVDRFFKEGYKKIIAAEPNPQLSDVLKLRFRNEEFTLIQKALSSYEGEIDFFLGVEASTVSTVSKKWITDSSFSADHHWWDDPIKVECTTLDNLIEEFGEPDLIKIDVENHEHKVLEGLSKNINSEIRFEWHQKQYENAQTACRRLVDLGYSKFACVVGTKGDVDFFTPEEIKGAGFERVFEYDIFRSNSDFSGVAKGILLDDSAGLSWKDLNEQLTGVMSSNLSQNYWGMIFAKKE